MTKYGNWPVVLGLVTISAALYTLNGFLFATEKVVFRSFLFSLAFLPLQVLFVTIVLGQFLAERAKQDKLKKLNMVIGAFFLEVGSDLLTRMTTFVSDPATPARLLAVQKNWTPGDFERASAALAQYIPALDPHRGDLESLSKLLTDHRAFLMRLLENGNLLEHESFSDLLWATTHMIEELRTRIKIEALTEKDAAHLAGDMKRAYILLIREWLGYMNHLKSDYPYLFSLAIETSPFKLAPSGVQA